MTHCPQAAHVAGEWHRIHRDGGGGLSTLCDRAVPEDAHVIGAESLVHATTHPLGSGICEPCLLADKLGTTTQENKA